MIESGIKSAFLFPSSVQAVGRVQRPAAVFHFWAKGGDSMIYMIIYDGEKCANYANSRSDLLEWLRILHDEKIDDILKISKSGDVTSVVEKYKKFL